MQFPPIFSFEVLDLANQPSRGLSSQISLQSGSFGSERGDLSGQFFLPGRIMQFCSCVSPAARSVWEYVILDREGCCIVDLINLCHISISVDQVRKCVVYKLRYFFEAFVLEHFP